MLKLFLAIFIFFSAFAGGWLAISMRASENSRVFLYLSDLFAKGVFLGICLACLLPSALREFGRVIHHLKYSAVFLICAATMIAVQLIEREMSKFFSNKHVMKNDMFVPFLLMIVLSLHSLVEGIILGVYSVSISIYIMFFAILAHKGSGAFALGIQLRKTGLSLDRIYILFVLFSIMTPIGILFGSILEPVFIGNAGSFARAVFSSIAAGIFIYIAALSSELFVDIRNQVSILKKALFLIGGILLIVAINVVVSTFIK